MRFLVIDWLIKHQWTVNSDRERWCSVVYNIGERRIVSLSVCEQFPANILKVFERKWAPCLSALFLITRNRTLESLW